MGDLVSQGVFRTLVGKKGSVAATLLLEGGFWALLLDLYYILPNLLEEPVEATDVVEEEKVRVRGEVVLVLVGEAKLV